MYRDFPEDSLVELIEMVDPLGEIRLTKDAAVAIALVGELSAEDRESVFELCDVIISGRTGQKQRIGALVLLARALHGAFIEYEE